MGRKKQSGETNTKAAGISGGTTTATSTGEDGSGNSSSDNGSDEREKALGYLERLKQRRLDSGSNQGTDSQSESSLPTDGSNGGTDGAGTDSNGERTGGIQDSTNGGRRSNRTASGSSRRHSGSSSDTGHSDSTTGQNVKLVFPKATRQETKKDNAKKKKIHLVLSDKESKELREDLCGVLKIVFEWMDDAISFTNRDKAKAEIWTAIDYEDMQKLADALIAIGKKNASTAVAIRGMVQSYLYMEAGIITSRRVYETFMFYREHHGFTIPGLM